MNIEQQERISFEKLHSILQTDVFYGVRAPFIPHSTPSRNCELTESGEDPSESIETASIISTIYGEYPTNPIFISFNIDYGWLPCSGDLQRHLVFIWCGLLGLKYQRDGRTPSEPGADLLKNWMRDFDIGKQDLKLFLRKHSWPLPVHFFWSEPDNTKNKVEKRPNIYRRFCYLQLEELPRLKGRLRDLNDMSPKTLIELKAKQQEQLELEKRIQIIERGCDPDKKPARKEIRNHKMLMIALGYRKGKSPKSWHNISRILERMDVSEGIKAGRIREVLRETYRTQKMEGK